MKYKVGDIVCIKSMSDIGKIIDSKGCIDGLPFRVAMNYYCNSRMTIDQIDDINGYYRMKEDPWHLYNDEMIERLVEDLIDNEIQEHQRICDEIMDIQGIEPIEAEMEQVIHCPDGYQFTDENGNVINATKIVLEKKKKEYPKTYEECYQVTGLSKTSDIYGYKNGLLFEFQKLLIARDAYWKIAGEEMGLGKPWEPDYNEESYEQGSPIKYVIYYTGTNITKERKCTPSYVLSFPTPEMRDAFKENFDPGIEICKEFL